MSTTTYSPVLADVALPKATTTGGAWARTLGLITAGIALTALFARIEIPMWPVPITGQTLAVLLVGATLGMRRGAAAMAGYAAVGLAGLPVFAGGAGGPQMVAAPSFGFILGFIPAAALIGYLSERTWDRKPVLAIAGFALATVVPFLVGVPYMGVVLSSLGTHVTFGLLMEYGVTPFLVGGAIKCAIAAALLPLAWKFLGRPSADA
ncbi:biotin transporter BioY [Bowdeniella nasicola]|nr:biotin transporter BioY [Bowdeniella nasicola]